MFAKIGGFPSKTSILIGSFPWFSPCMLGENPPDFWNDPHLNWQDLTLWGSRAKGALRWWWFHRIAGIAKALKILGWRSNAICWVWSSKKKHHEFWDALTNAFLKNADWMGCDFAWIGLGWRKRKPFRHRNGWDVGYLGCFRNGTLPKWMRSFWTAILCERTVPFK